MGRSLNWRPGSLFCKSHYNTYLHDNCKTMLQAICNQHVKKNGDQFSASYLVLGRGKEGGREGGRRMHYRYI